MRRWILTIGTYGLIATSLICAAFGLVDIQNAGAQAGGEETEGGDTEFGDTEFGDTEQSTPELANLVQSPRWLHPDVVTTIDVDLGALGAVGGELVTLREAESKAELDLRVSLGRRSILEGTLLVTNQDLGAALALREVALSDHEGAEQDLADLAVSTFVAVEEAALGGFDSANGADSLETVSREAEVLLTEDLAAAATRRSQAEKLVLKLEVEVEGLLGAIAAQEELEVDARQRSLEARDSIERAEPRFERELMTARLRETDIPVVVFDAYYRAQLNLAGRSPGCEVAWHQLAGIGKVESSHGSFGGNTVGRDGRTDGEILGPLLDGDPFSAISDTDGGELDGDSEWDRAVGPMQFIPGSWTIYGADGNEDGVSDPHNIYDAAVAAGRHLCGTSTFLAERVNFQRALLGYNQSAVYGVDVMGKADRYLEVVGPVVAAADGQVDDGLAAHFS